MTTFIKKKLKDREGNYLVTPSSADIVYCSDGETVATKLRKVENDEFSPTITQMSSVSKVGVGEDIDISDNTQEGYLKSAILSGNTLKKDAFVKWATVYGNNVVCPIYHDGSINRSYKVYANRRYTVIRRGIWENVGYSFYNDTNEFIQGNIKSETFIPNVDGYIQIFVSGGEELRTEDNYKNFIVIEGEADKSIPYFEGMQSVKMPVLTTTGKNLFNNEFTTISNYDNQMYSRVNVNKIIGKNGNFTISVLEELNSKGKIWFNLYINGAEKFNLIVNGATANKKYNFLLNEQNQVEFGVYSEGISKQQALENIKNNFKIQLEQGSTATAYEPYKSNILSCNEEVTLRGIGDVKDTLDGNTGELTQRIGEIVLDGSENWKIFKQGRYYIKNILNNVNRPHLDNINFKCDKLKPISYSEEYSGTLGISLYAGTNYDFIVRTDIQAIEEFKQWLSQNPTTVQYRLATESIKTVDLEPSGTNPTTQPYVWKDGYIQLSSEEGSLLPTLDYSVTTSRGGQILENTKHIAKQDKRIYDLEMLMINSSVEDAYQRLLLQNDVQVMSRMDETHLNPMRYYMLTRLIEEKMYEETDMLNKLDTFFLYGDISSDQYFELMDKIFGMEEIIEEDFTEEK